MTQKSLLTAYLLDGQGGGKKLGWDEVNAWTPDQGVLWLHLDYTAKASQHWLKTVSGLDRLTVDTLKASETRPRSIINSDGLLVILRSVNLNPGKDPEDMVSVRVWLDKNRIITTRSQRLLSIQDLEDAIIHNHGPRTNTELLVMLNEYVLNRISNVVDAYELQIDEIEQEILGEGGYELRSKIAELRRQAIMIRRYLAPQREALYRLQFEKTKWLAREDQVHLRESNDRIVRFIEDLDSARERALVSQEELSAKLSEQLDRRMYVLSLVAVIFLPLSFITGLLGINVDGIPGAKYPHAFEVVCILLAGIFAGLYTIFKRKKWL